MGKKATGSFLIAIMNAIQLAIDSTSIIYLLPNETEFLNFLMHTRLDIFHL